MAGLRNGCEEAPAGIDAEILSALAAQGDTNGAADRRCDLYSLWAAMTALTQEVKLEGRAFKDLNDTLTSQGPRVAEEIRGVYKEREREQQREVERHCRKQILGDLIDLRDRLSRGIESVKAARRNTASATGQLSLRLILPQSNWMRRLVQRIASPRQTTDEGTTAAALRKGYELGLERLDQTLEEFNARQIRCEGQMFDPRRMNAIDKEETTSVPEGTVIEVYRNGYEWNGEVFRPRK